MNVEITPRLFAGPVTSLLGLLLTTAFSQIAAAQVRPTIMNPGEASESRAQPARVDRSHLGVTKATRPAYSVLIILTAPKNAEVSINGKPAGRAVNGRFKKELPARAQYKVSVSAGPDYEDYDEVITLKPREPAIVEAPLISKFGIVRIFPAKDGVKILDNDQAIPSNNLSLDKEDRIVIKGLNAGDHEITYDLPGYVLYERRFKITPGIEHTWNFVPERAVVEMTVATEAKTVVYVDGKQLGTTPGNGTLKQIVELGPHEIKLVKEDFEEYTTIVQFEFGKPVRLEKRLVPLPSSDEFSDDFDVAKPHLWTMPPSGISIREGKLHLDNASALALPTNIRYRDFEMTFHLKLTNAGGAAWAVRVKDSTDYYLFYLSGPNGLFPNRFNTYIVRNNEFDPKKMNRSDNVTARLTAGGQYGIRIKATGNKIEHEITPAETGKAESLGFFADLNNTLRYGGIGFRTVSSEKFAIDDLFVWPR